MAYFLLRVWSSPAASHNAHFDSAAVSPVGGGECLQSSRRTYQEGFLTFIFAINWVILKNIDNGRKTERGEKNEFAIVTAGRW